MGFVFVSGDASLEGGKAGARVVAFLARAVTLLTRGEKIGGPGS